MRIKKVNELNTTEIHPLMGGKLANDEATSLLDFFVKINEEAAQFKKVADYEGLTYGAYMKGGVINFIADGENPLTLTVKMDFTFKHDSQKLNPPKFGSRTSSYVPPHPQDQ